MILELESYLSNRKRVAVMDLSHALGVAPDALRGMLGVLQRKGRVRKLEAGTLCEGGCTRCAPETIEIFEWVE